jgi:hypothetical protein
MFFFFFRIRKRTKNPLASGPAVSFSVNGQCYGPVTANPKKSMPVEEGNGGFIRRYLMFFLLLFLLPDSR